MQEKFEEFWTKEYHGIIDSGQPQILIDAWRHVAWKGFVAGYKAGAIEAEWMMKQTTSNEGYEL